MNKSTRNESMPEEQFLEALNWLREIAGGNRTAHNRDSRREYAQRLLMALDTAQPVRRAFPIVDVISVYMGRSVADEVMEHFDEILTFLNSPYVSSSSQHVPSPQVRRWLEALHPCLKKIDATTVTQEAFPKWRKRIIIDFGEVLVLSPFPCGLVLYQHALNTHRE